MSENKLISKEEQRMIAEMHGDFPELGTCLGADCPTKDCRICPASVHGRGRVFHDSEGNSVQMESSWDSYREKMKKHGGYYTRSIIEIVLPNGEKRYIYSRPD